MDKDNVTIVEFDEDKARKIEQLETIALWLDRRFLDPLLGFLFPGGGNTLGSLAGVYGVFVALQIGVHPVVVTRMLLNLAIDSLLGSFPVIGVVFDVFYRAHVRNLDLIKRRGSYGKATTSDWVIVLGAALLFVIALLIPVLVLGLLLYLVFDVTLG